MKRVGDSTRYTGICRIEKKGVRIVLHSRENDTFYVVYLIIKRNTGYLENNCHDKKYCLIYPRSAKRLVFDLSPGMVFEIFKYINPFLHYLVSRNYFHDVINIDYDKRLPTSLLLSLHNLGVLENFKAVLLISLKFRENLEEQIAMYGDYSTMMWFQDHDITLS